MKLKVSQETYQKQLNAIKAVHYLIQHSIDNYNHDSIVLGPLEARLQDLSKELRAMTICEECSNEY